MRLRKIAGLAAALSVLGAGGVLGCGKGESFTEEDMKRFEQGPTKEDREAARRAMQQMGQNRGAAPPRPEGQPGPAGPGAPSGAGGQQAPQRPQGQPGPGAPY